MAHTGIYATAAECTSKAGELVDATGWVEANINQWCAEAESYINCAARTVFAVDSTAFTALSSAKKKLLTEATSCLVAIYGIQYNMAGYTTRIEAEDMITTLMYRFNECMKLLKDQDVVSFIMGTYS